MYWESLTRVPDIGTSKNLSNYTGIGTALGTYSSMFTESVFVWVPVPVTLLRKALQGTLDLCRSVWQLFIHRFVLHTQLHINNSTKHKQWIFFYTKFFRRLFLDYSLVENMPISIVNWERTTLRCSDGDPSKSGLVRSRKLTCLSFQNWKN